MKKRKIDIIQKIYDCDLAKNLFIIKMSIKNYSDIFNELDPSPLKRRDVDQYVVSYLDDCSEDIPMKYSLEIQIMANNESPDIEEEKRVRLGLKTYFSYSILYYKKQINNSYKKSLLWLLTSISLIFMSFYLTSIITPNIIMETVIEGLSIGGWVFLWEAIALMFFKVRETKIKCRQYERLEESPINFVYNDN